MPRFRATLAGLFTSSNDRGVKPLLQVGFVTFGLVCAWFVLIEPAHAQSVSGGSRQFTVLAGGEADWQGIAYQRTATDAVPVAFSPQRRSEVQKAAGETLVFTRERIDPATAKPVRVAVARASWPAAVRTALLVFVPRATTGADGIEFDVLAMDDGDEGFPADTVRLLNLSPWPLLARLGEHNYEMKSGALPPIRLADVASKEAASLALAVGVRTGEGLVPLYLGPIEIRPLSRVLVLVLPPRVDGSRKVRVNVITQTVAKPAVK